MPQVVVSREEPHWRLTLPPTETLPADEPSPPRKADKWNILDRCDTNGHNCKADAAMRIRGSRGRREKTSNGMQNPV
jgi:hypothetical protein